uniref:Uncharacterized protein n=1 Tax=Junco hyemalis TaxID=40217 RepID=A0A8C5JJ71_JUNHY
MRATPPGGTRHRWPRAPRCSPRSGKSCSPSVCSGNSCSPSVCSGNSCSPSVCSGNSCSPSVCSGKSCSPSVCSGNSCNPSVCSGNSCNPSVCSGNSCSPSVCSGNSCNPSVCSGNSCLFPTSACADQAMRSGRVTIRAPWAEKGIPKAAISWKNPVSWCPRSAASSMVSCCCE